MWGVGCRCVHRRITSWVRCRSVRSARRYVAEAGRGAAFYCATCNTGYQAAPANARGWPICPVCERPMTIRSRPLGRTRPVPRPTHARATSDAGGPVLVDASYQNGWCGIAGVFLEDGWQLFAGVRPVPSSQRAEVLAVREAVEMLKARGWDREVWTDSKAVAERYGSGVVWVGRRVVAPAHTVALRELRLWLPAR